VGAPQRRRIAPGLPDARCVIQSTASCATSQAAAVRRIRLACEQVLVRPQGDQRASLFSCRSEWNRPSRDVASSGRLPAQRRTSSTCQPQNPAGADVTCLGQRL